MAAMSYCRNNVKDWAIRSEASINNYLLNIGGGQMEWTLTSGAVVLIDKEDYEKIPKTGWYLVDHPTRNSRTAYVGHDDYGRLHRYILGLTDPDDIVDHIDRDGLNNQRSNLRVVSNSINKRNQSTVKSNQFNFNGIRFEKGYQGRKPRYKASYSTHERDHRYGDGRYMQKTKSFTIYTKEDYTLKLKEAILYRIDKMREYNYFIDERSTTIEQAIKENPDVDIEALLGIDLKTIVLSRVGSSDPKQESEKI